MGVGGRGRGRGRVWVRGCVWVYGVLCHGVCMPWCRCVYTVAEGPSSGTHTHPYTHPYTPYTYTYTPAPIHTMASTAAAAAAVTPASAMDSANPEDDISYFETFLSNEVRQEG